MKNTGRFNKENMRAILITSGIFLFFCAFLFNDDTFSKVDVSQDGASIVLANIADGDVPLAGKSLEDCQFSTFCWDEAFIGDYEQFLQDCKSLGVTRIYQCFQKNLLGTDELHTFLAAMHEAGIEIYWVNGDPSWAVEQLPDALSYVDAIGEFNEASTEKVDGILFDIEYYCLPDYDAKQEEYNSIALEAYKTLREEGAIYGLPVGQCVNYQVANANIGEYEQIVSEACDFVAVMAYCNDIQYQAIKNLLVICDRYDVPLDVLTYYASEPSDTTRHSLEEGEKEWQIILERSQSDNLGFCYYDYRDELHEMIK